MPNARIQNTVANVRVGVNLPNARVSSFQTTRTGDALIAAGTPIGLLLALTYATQQSLPFFSDFRPNVRIRTT